MNGYLSLTRTHSYSLVFALPLLLLYEAGALYLAESEGSNLRNGADVLLRVILSVVGVEGTAGLAVVIALVAAGLVLLERSKRKIPLRLTPFLGMAIESVVYAALLGTIVGAATQGLLEVVAMQAAAGTLTSLSFEEAIILSLGAGLYEELAFRVLLVGGIFAILRGSGATVGQSAVLAAVVASVIFSGFHYIGPYGDAWALPSFLFRFLAGLAFSVLFLLRGFGVTAWTHALYDIFLVVAIGR